MPEQQDERGEIYVVDDDPVVRDMLSLILSREGYRVVCFADGHSLLAATRTMQPLCILLDVHIPGRSGLDVLKQLHASDYPTPIIMMSGKGDIPTAVDAARHGAFDFIEKPFRGSQILARLNDAVSHHLRMPAASDILPADFAGREHLTSREIEVLEQCVRGASSKEAAKALGVSPRTIEDHRANLLRKLGAASMVDLVRRVMAK